MENYISKQTSYDVAYDVAQKAKKVLGLSEYDRETLEHDINNLRAHEWIDLFNMIPDSNEVKKLYFTHCVELETENEQELDESMNTFTTVRTRLNRLCSPYQAQLWNNGRFEVHQVKEDDKDRIVNSLRRISKEVHATANGKYDFSRPAMFGGMHSQYYNIYGEIEMKDQNESLQLTEGHDVQEYKGFELDLDTDLTNHNWEDEEYVITPTIEIKYNGKVLATANGYRAARAWVDKHVKVVPYTTEQKAEQIARFIDQVQEAESDGNIVYIFNPSGSEAGYIYVKSFDEIYSAYWGESLEDCLDFNKITLEDLYKVVPLQFDDEDPESYFSTLIDNLLEVDKDVTDLPFITKHDSIKDMIDNLSGWWASFVSMTSDEEKELIKVQDISIDGKALKESHNDQELKENMSNKVDESLNSRWKKMFGEPYKDSMSKATPQQLDDLKKRLLGTEKGKDAKQTSKEIAHESYSMQESTLTEDSDALADQKKKFAEYQEKLNEVNKKIEELLDKKRKYDSAKPEEKKQMDMIGVMDSVSSQLADYEQKQKHYMKEMELLDKQIKNNGENENPKVEDPKETGYGLAIFQNGKYVQGKVYKNSDEVNAVVNKVYKTKTGSGSLILVGIRPDKTLGTTIELKLGSHPSFNEIKKIQLPNDIKSQMNQVAKDLGFGGLKESLDQTREKALKMKESSNAFAILYGYRTKDGKEVELEPEELKEDMESNKKLMLVWEHFNPSNINLIYDNDFSRLESYMSTEDDIICEDEGAVESGIFLLAHNDESEMLSFVGHSIEDVKTKFIQAVEQAKVEAQEYEDEDLNLGDPFYYCTDNLNLSSEEMFNEWISWITSSQVDGDSGYAWHLIDVANKQVLYGSEESEVIFYDSVDEYFNDLTGGLDNTEGEELEENTITNTFPPVIDQFLMDCAQMYCNFDYTDISKFGERATEDEIKLLRKIRADLKDGFDEDDPEVKDIFNEIEKIVKGTDLTESVLMEKDPNLTDSQKKYVEDMYNKDMEFYGFASYDSEDDFVEDVTIDFDELEAIEMYKYYKQLHEVNGTDESLNGDLVEETELDDSSNSNIISDLAKELRVNGPRSRQDRKPEPVPGCINEINIPDEMRYKEYDFREENGALYIKWITQGSFTSEDVDIFIDEVASAIDDVAKDLGIFDKFDVIIEVTSRDGKESGYAKETLRFEHVELDSEQIEEARSNNSLSARLKARLNKLTECNSEDQLTEEKLSTRLIRRLNQGKINEASIVEEVTDVDLTEESLKWNMGSDKLVSTDSEEFAKLVDLAKLLQEKSPNGFMYTVEKTYEDFGAGMQWYNIICHNKKGDRWQVLNTKQWLELANGKLTVEQSYDSIIKDEYFQDKISGDVNTMNHSQLLKFMDSFDEEII